MCLMGHYSIVVCTHLTKIKHATQRWVSSTLKLETFKIHSHKTPSDTKGYLNVVQSLGFFSVRTKSDQWCSSLREDLLQWILSVYQWHTAKLLVCTGSIHSEIHWGSSIWPRCCAHTPRCSSLDFPIHLAHLNSTMGDLQRVGWTVKLPDKTAN